MTASKFNPNNPQSDILSQLSQLNKQLISYRVLDRLGNVRATVTDVDYTSEGTQYLLIKLLGENAQLSLHRLTSDRIRQLDIGNRTMVSDLDYEQILELPLYQPVPPFSETDKELLASSKVKESQQISLLEEKLKINRHKRKVGEVIVRKQIETYTIQVPMRREKLIVERVGQNPEQIAEVVVGESKVNGFEPVLIEDDNQHITRSQYLNIKTARQLVQALSGLSSAKNAKIRLEIVSNSSQEQMEQRNLCDRFRES